MPSPSQIVRRQLASMLLAVPTGILAGLASALLIVSLNWATSTRESHPWLLALLPLGGLVVGLMYHRLGRSVEAGNNLILENIHAEVSSPQTMLPFRMTPLILLGTTLTHLFGGSAGREGTALQTGASLADQLTWVLRRYARIDLSYEARQTLLITGLAAGFGSVFGTPLAGTVFGAEVIAPGRLRLRTLLPCAVAAYTADATTHALGVHHTVYLVRQLCSFTPATMLSALAAGICFGLVALAFSRLTHLTSLGFKRLISYPPMRPFVGGTIVALLVLGVGTTKYIGLGIPTILQSFSQPLPTQDFALKLLFTVITLSAGFKGGEVTPLFFIGATLGNSLSALLDMPSSLLAGMGFVAVFSGAANTPIAGTVMAYELFGPKVAGFAALACLGSYLFSGSKGIYHAQRHTLRKLF